MTKRLFVLALALAASMAATTARAESVLDFTLVNKTGYGISEVYVAPSEDEDWGESLISEVFENNESLDISFQPKAGNIKKWDILIVFVDDDTKVYWRGYELAKIHKITLHYDRNSGKTSATTE